MKEMIEILEILEQKLEKDKASFKVALFSDKDKLEGEINATLWSIAMVKKQIAGICEREAKEILEDAR